jgi:hypothetical protein
MVFEIETGGGVVISIEHPFGGAVTTYKASAPAAPEYVVARRKMLIAAAKVLDAATAVELNWLLDVKLENARA